MMYGALLQWRIIRHRDDGVQLLQSFFVYFFVHGGGLLKKNKFIGFLAGIPKVNDIDLI